MGTSMEMERRGESMQMHNWAYLKHASMFIIRL